MIMVLMIATCGAVWAQDTIVFQKRASMPSVPKTESGYFVIDSNLYVVGGGDSIGNFYKEVWRYNISSDSWLRMRDFVGGRISSPGAFALNGKGYICSGLDSQVNWNSWVWEYNPGSDIWTQKANFPGLPRQFPTCFTYNNIGYMHSGYPTRGTDLWKYDPVQDQWVEMDTLPSQGRFGNTASVIDSFAYFFGVIIDISMVKPPQKCGDTIFPEIAGKGCRIFRELLALQVLLGVSTNSSSTLMVPINMTPLLNFQMISICIMGQAIIGSQWCFKILSTVLQLATVLWLVIMDIISGV
jgi:hypothetical protein